MVLTGNTMLCLFCLKILMCGKTLGNIGIYYIGLKLIWNNGYFSKKNHFLDSVIHHMILYYVYWSFVCNPVDGKVCLFQLD